MARYLLCKIFCVGLLIGIGVRTPIVLSAEPLQGKRETWRSKWDLTVAAAKKEGKVIVYGPGSILREKVYTQHFEEAFPGIRVIYVTGGASLARILAERRAGKYLPDIYLGGTRGGSVLRALRSLGAIQPVRPALLLPEVVDESKWFEGKLWFNDKEGKYSLIFALAVSTTIAVNTDLVNPKEIVSYKQLLEPKWRGKIVSNDLTRGGAGSGNIVFWYTNPELGPDFIKKLYGEMDVTMSRNRQQAIDWLARGRFHIYLFPALHRIHEARDVGLPIDVVNPKQMKEGYSAVAGLNQVSLMNPAPHPHAAKVYVNWLLSRDAQTAFEKIVRYPSLRVDTPTKSRLPEAIVPEAGGSYKIISLEKYWPFSSEVIQMLKKIVRKR